MIAPNESRPFTEWGRWLHDLAFSSDGESAKPDIAEINLQCAADLPGTDNSLLGDCLQKVDEWANVAERYTEALFHHFRKAPDRFQNSESQFRIVALAQCVQCYISVSYNFGFLEGDYDGGDSRNLFLHGVLTGFGGTCVSMPVLYCAIGRRLGYPLTMAETREHFFCRWDDDREHFCFDATSRGATMYSEDRYRHWPRPITDFEERKNGFIRPMTRREELAAFATARSLCLMEHLRFQRALESAYLAHRIAPDKLCLNHGWGIADYSSRIWNFLLDHADELKAIPIEQRVQLAAKKLRGHGADFFRAAAAENVLRIIRNRRRRDRVARYETVIQELTTTT